MAGTSDADIMGQDANGRAVILRSDGTWSYVSDDRQFCVAHASKAVAQQDLNLSLGCGISGPAWHRDEGRHRNWYARVPIGEAAQHAKARAEALAACRYHKNRCPEYATRAVQQQQANLNRRCDLTGATWHTNHQRHVNWCKRVPPGQAKDFAEARVAALARCKATNEPCRAYADRSVWQQRKNLNEGCGIDPTGTNPQWTTDRAFHLRLCASVGQPARDALLDARAKSLHANCGRGTGSIRAYLGVWSFGRSMNAGANVDQHLCRIELLETFVPDRGYKLESCNPNESFWRLEGGDIVFLNDSGTPSTRFSQIAPNS